MGTKDNAEGLQAAVTAAQGYPPMASQHAALIEQANEQLKTQVSGGGSGDGGGPPV